MIAFVRGQVAAVTLSSAVLEVGGVGLELICTPGTLATLRPGHQAMLAVHTPDELRRAVAAEDVKTLTTLPGIGQKGAQRIILELKDRIGPVRGGRTAPTAAATAPWRDQVHQGLVGLGWSTRDAEDAVEAVAPEAGDTPDVGTLLRAALRTLSKA